MRASTPVMDANSIPCRGTACYAPACPGADVEQGVPRDSFERVFSLGGRSFSSDSKHTRLWALAPEEMLLSFVAPIEGKQ